MKTTLRKILAAGPCGTAKPEPGDPETGFRLLRQNLGKGWRLDKSVSIIQILDSNGIDDALWALRAVDGHEREMRLFACWCALQVPQSETGLACIDAAEKFTNGTKTADEMYAARYAARSAAQSAAQYDAWSAALSAARYDAWSAAQSAAQYDAWSAALSAARYAARSAARSAQSTELRRVCECVNAGIDPYPMKGTK